MNATASTPSTAARDVDIRGFSYPLEPVRQRQQWQLDRSLAALGRAQKLLDQTEEQLKQLRETHDAQARALSEATLRRLDPGAHRRALGYLTHLRERSKELETLRDTQRLARDELRRECTERRLRLDGLDRHKEDALTDYAHEIRQRNANEQDRDWLARRGTPVTAKEQQP
ncbi:hypothetical protein [Variovorax sp. CY25R-8]|uniref:hypothetical protein n=1 Tax=Variovorax sp. CY25R-8 TaxID=2855501 RepID=UPI0021BADA9C|nr:hypothetical protein [Variovorax sp. CY25R-8]MCT8175460.1 hypothetical protein [Variovorax sp. CY25R-8]